MPRRGLPADFSYPAVLKPIDGAGTMDTYLVTEAGACPVPARSMGSALLQPYAQGVPMSASFLVGADGRAHPIAAGRQEIAIEHGRFHYRGGTVPVEPLGLEVAAQAVAAVPGLAGFVGVDYVWDDVAKCGVVLEINPRPTTSMVGLTRAAGRSPGSLARRWLEGLIESDPDREEAGRTPILDWESGDPVTFAADGRLVQVQGRSRSTGRFPP